MSSKHAAAGAAKEILLHVLTLITTGKFADIPLKKLQYLRRYNYIQSIDNAYTLTSKGEKNFSEGKIWALKIATPKKWDSKWRVVLFDIPADKRKRRDSFRRRIKEMGLTMYQNSVWVYPYPLEKEVWAIADFYMISRCVSFITTESITGEPQLRKRYKLG